MDDLVAVVDARHLVEQLAAWGEVLAEAAGIAIILIGTVLATGIYLRRVLRRSPSREAYRDYRHGVAKGILLGLEFLVAADIIGTVLIDLTFYNLGVLAALVAVRTFLSFSLTVEVEGRWPWQHREAQDGE